MTKCWTTGAIVLALMAGPLACGTPAPAPVRPPVPPAPPALRVGVSPAAPPLAFKQGGHLTGVEVDLATQLAAGLGRTPRFVELPWDDLIPALLNDRIDIIMSGMTVTPLRGFRIAFSEPYLKSGLMAMMRRSDTARYDSVAKVLDTSATVGVTGGTTSEKFVRGKIPGAVVSVYPTAADAVGELRQNRIDLLVSGMPIVGWFVSENEAELAALRTPLADESLAWGFRPTDDALLAAANGQLAHWKEDGTLSRILRRWLRLWPGPL